MPIFYSTRFIPAYFFRQLFIAEVEKKIKGMGKESFVHIARSTVLAWNPKNVIVSFIFWLNCFDMRTRCLTFSWFRSKMLLSKMLTVQCFGCSLFFFCLLFFSFAIYHLLRYARHYIFSFQSWINRCCCNQCCLLSLFLFGFRYLLYLSLEFGDSLTMAAFFYLLIKWSKISFVVLFPRALHLF